VLFFCSLAPAQNFPLRGRSGATTVGIPCNPASSEILFYDTTAPGRGLYLCTATNTWTLVTTNGAAIASIQSSAYNSCSDAGASDAYACSLSPSIAAYTTGQVVWFKANTANFGAATINLNALGAKTIKRDKDVDLINNDIKAGQWVALQYDGTNFQMISPIANQLRNVTDNGTNAVIDRAAAAGGYVQLGNTSGGGYLRVTPWSGGAIAMGGSTVSISGGGPLDGTPGRISMSAINGSDQNNTTSIDFSMDSSARTIFLGSSVRDENDEVLTDTSINVNVLDNTITLTTIGSKPACDASRRGAWFTTQGGAGVADKTEQCMKRANDAYAWVAVVTAP
jgi:hypothetical protein